MWRTISIFLISLFVSLVLILLVSLVVRSQKGQTDKTTFNLDFYYGEQNYLVDRDFFDDLDYTKDE